MLDWRGHEETVAGIGGLLDHPTTTWFWLRSCIVLTRARSDLWHLGAGFWKIHGAHALGRSAEYRSSARDSTRCEDAWTIPHGLTRLLGPPWRGPSIPTTIA